MAKAGSALNQAIVCASESFKLNITTYAEAAGETVQGYWREATRDVSGHLTGRIGDGVFDGEISAAAFTASISLTSNGRSQAVFAAWCGTGPDLRRAVEKALLW
ncbi:MAG: hypothetical protein JO288_08340, partial [Hyphomicrobiales bacterium]|nr:hypothetical protein [Hyphomicrobiales bacterium]